MATAAASLSGIRPQLDRARPSRSAQSESENEMSIIEGFRTIGRTAALGAAVLAAVSLTVTPGTAYAQHHVDHGGGHGDWHGGGHGGWHGGNSWRGGNWH